MRRGALPGAASRIAAAALFALSAAEATAQLSVDPESPDATRAPPALTPRDDLAPRAGSPHDTRAPAARAPSQDQGPAAASPYAKEAPPARSPEQDQGPGATRPNTELPPEALQRPRF
jgi:hypothetical protein